MACFSGYGKQWRGDGVSSAAARRSTTTWRSGDTVRSDMWQRSSPAWSTRPWWGAAPREGAAAAPRWDLAARHPELFAAFAPVASHFEPWRFAWAARRLKGLPIWAFHGRGDFCCPFDNMEALVKSLEPSAGLTVYSERRVDRCGEHSIHNSATRRVPGLRTRAASLVSSPAHAQRRLGL